MDLLSDISNDAFDFYSSKLVSEGSISDNGKYYNIVKSAPIQRFKKRTSREKAIAWIMSAVLVDTDLLNSLKNVDELYKPAGLNEEAKFGLLPKLSLDDKDLSRLLLFQNLSYYNQLLKSIKNYSSATENFSQTPNINYPKAFLQMPDDGTRGNESKTNSLAPKRS